MKYHEYAKQLPEFLVGIVTLEIYIEWLNGRAGRA
jgi:hypothetical protein